MKDFQIRLIAKYKNKHYHLASLAFKKERELIYVFEYFDRRRFFNFHDFETGVERIQRQVDHISFHKDGGIHIYYKDLKGNGERMEKNKLGINPFILEGDKFISLLIHSFYFDEVRINLQKEINDTNNQDFLIEVTNSNRFSIVLFSLGSKINYRNMLASHGFEKIFEILNSKFLCEPFLDHTEEDISRIEKGLFKENNFLLAFTKKTIPIPIKLIEFEKKRGNEIGSIAPFSILPSEDKIINRLK